MTLDWRRVVLSALSLFIPIASAIGADQPQQVKRCLTSTEVEQALVRNPPGVELEVTSPAAATYSALADYLFNRAKSEAEAYLKEEAMKTLCKGDQGRYFPNACELIGVQTPDRISTNKLIAKLRLDLQGLPGCYVFLRESSSPYDPAKVYRNEKRLWGYKANNEITSFLATPKDKRDYAKLVEEVLKDFDVTITSSETAALVKVVTSAVNAEQGGRDTEFAVLLIAIAANVPQSTKYEKVLKVLAAYSDIKAKQYSDAVSKIAGLFDECQSKPPSEWCGIAAKVAQIAEAPDGTQAKQAMDALFGAATSTHEFPRIGLLSISAMVGIQGGRERISAPVGSANTFGAFLPVGLDLNLPISDHTLCSSWGGFLSIIDLGAWVSYSTPQSSGAGSTNGTTSATASSALSPGLYGTCTIRASAFRLGFGVSRTPSLRSVNLAGGGTQSATSTRLLFYLAWDLPLMDLKRF